jgi:hypothetical protein
MLGAHTDINNGPAVIQNIADNASNKFKDTYENKVNDQGLKHVQQEANKQGLNKAVIQEQLSGTKSNLSGKASAMRLRNDNKIFVQEHISGMRKEGMKQQSEKLEKSRLSKHIGIGGPTAQERILENFKPIQIKRK